MHRSFITAHFVLPGATKEAIKALPAFDHAP